MKKFRGILYGGDYNPNQWPKEIWKEDMRIFKNAHINSATINVFSWAKLQPSEDLYDFSQLDEIIAMLSEENYEIVLATSTGALPAWMVAKYPEVARTDYEGRHHKFGQRHNACPNSPVFQKFSAALAGKLAQRYGSNPHVKCWHISNEYSGDCYCENCEKAFRVWLKEKYKTIGALNKAWNMEFWGHTVYDWDEIVLPNVLSEGFGNDRTAFAGISIDYRRFNSDGMLSNYKNERDAIREFDKETPITTNLMGTYKGLDYFKWAKEMDIISWDNYPSYNTPWSESAMCHDLMRGLKNAPFMLMEQTPSQQNWQPYNSLKRPGQMRAQSYQTIAHGADTIQFFQLRRSVGACEKFHGAVIAHAGTENTRVFREVQQLGEELERLGDILPGSVNEAKTGIVFDWDNYWALEYTSGPSVDLTYVKHIHAYYEYFYDKNIAVNLIPVDADFSSYQLIVAPVLYMVKEGMAEALEEFVKNGGTLVLTYMSGIVGESDNVHLGGYPGPLRKLAGVWVEEIDALAPEQFNEVVMTSQKTYSCGLVCDLMHLEGAECLGTYGTDFYEGMPAVTHNRFGKGHVYYVGTHIEKQGLYEILNIVVNSAAVESIVSDGDGLEIVCRKTQDSKIYFVMNFSEVQQPIPALFYQCQDLLSGEIVSENTLLKKYDVYIFERKVGASYGK